MREIRLARKGEVAQQKEIWKLCFGDSDQYINFFYAHWYKEDDTMLLLQDNEVSAMLTMFPISTVTPDQRSFQSSMLYAIATHPKYQKRGFATQLMEYTHQYLREKNYAYELLVPAEKELINFYLKQGYQKGFYIRESLLTREKIESLPVGKAGCIITGITPEEYNLRRNKQLQGRLSVVYTDEEIAYQKKLSQFSGADIYGIEIAEVQGCVVIERLNSDKVYIKEILVPDRVLPIALKEILGLLPAKKYVVRTPAFLGKELEGDIRPFAMIRPTGGIDIRLTPEDLGYLGLAFD